MRLKLLATAILCFTFAGCGEVFEKTERVPIDKVPEAVMKVAKKGAHARNRAEYERRNAIDSIRSHRLGYQFRRPTRIVPFRYKSILGDGSRFFRSCSVYLAVETMPLWRLNGLISMAFSEECLKIMRISIIALNRMVEEQSKASETYRQKVAMSGRPLLSDGRSMLDDDLLSKLHSFDTRIRMTVTPDRLNLLCGEPTEKVLDTFSAF